MADLQLTQSRPANVAVQVIQRTHCPTVRYVSDTRCAERLWIKAASWGSIGPPWAR